MNLDLTYALPIGISVASFAVSVVTLWLTQLRLGTVHVTQPSQIYLGPDGEPHFSPQVFVRTLLYSTSNRGRCVEQLFVKLRRGESAYNFSVWVHGTKGALVRASGILVGPNGVDLAHHFLRSDDSSFQFQSGDYVVELHMKLARERRTKIVFSHKLSVSEQEASLMNSPFKGLYFDWGPDSQSYQKHVRPTQPGIVIPALTESQTANKSIG